MLQHVNKAAQQLGFGGNWLKPIAEAAQPVVEATKEVAKRPDVWAAIGGIALTAGQTALAIATSPVTLTVGAVVGTAYLVDKLSEEDDD